MELDSLVNLKPNLAKLDNLLNQARYANSSETLEQFKHAISNINTSNVKAMKVLDLRFRLPSNQEKCSLFNEDQIDVTLIQKATIFGLTEFVSLLLKLTPLNKESSIPPLLLAGYYGHVDLVYLLIENMVRVQVLKLKGC